MAQLLQHLRGNISTNISYQIIAQQRRLIPPKVLLPIARMVFPRNFKGLCNVAQVKNFWEFLCWTIKSMTMFLSYAQCNKMSSWNGLYILFVSIYPGKCDLSNENKLKDVNWVKKQSVKKKNVLNYGYKPINSPP